MGDGQQTVDSAPELPDPSYDAGAVGRVYRAITAAGMCMAMGGVAFELWRVGTVRRGLWPVDEVFAAIVAGEPSAWTTLGIMVLLTGPILALISMFFSGVRRRSWLAVVLSVVVFAVILLAIPIKTWVEGGL